MDASQSLLQKAPPGDLEKVSENEVYLSLGKISVADKVNLFFVELERLSECSKG